LLWKTPGSRGEEYSLANIVKGLIEFAGINHNNNIGGKRMADCSKCGANNKDNAKFCKSCGTSMASVAAPAMTCSACAQPLAAGAKFCKKCGTSVAMTAPSAPVEPIPIHTATPVPANEADTYPPPFEKQPAVPAEPGALPQAGRAETRPSSSFSRPVTGIAVALVAVALAGGAFYFWSAKKQAAIEQPVQAEPPHMATAPEPVTPPSSQPASLTNPVASAPATQPAQAAPNANVVPVAAPESSVASEPATTPKIVASPAPKAALATRSPSPPTHQNPVVSAPTARPDLIASKVTTLLSKAGSYLANRQYDRAIATAESALELDPDSSAARSLISKAKARQMDALKSGAALE